MCFLPGMQDGLTPKMPWDVFKDFKHGLKRFEKSKNPLDLDVLGPHNSNGSSTKKAMTPGLR